MEEMRKEVVRVRLWVDASKGADGRTCRHIVAGRGVTAAIRLISWPWVLSVAVIWSV